MNRLERADALIAECRSKLEGVIAGEAWPEIKSQALNYLRVVEFWARQPDGSRDGALGDLGPNGRAPGIDDIVKQAEFATRSDQFDTPSVSRKAA